MTDQVVQVFPPGPNSTDFDIQKWREDLTANFSGIVANIDGDIYVEIDPGTGKPKDIWAVPPAPAYFTATATVNTVILEWNIPDITYVQYTEIYRGTVDNIDDADTVLVTTIENLNNSVVFSRSWADNPPNPAIGATYYYWIRFLNSAGTPGPLYQQAGVSASLPKDPSYALEQLADSIGYSQFDVANGIFPVRIGTTLPTLPNADWPVGSMFFDTDEGSDGKLYRTEDGLTWKASIDGAEVDALSIDGVSINASAITSDKIGTGAVLEAKLAANAVTVSKIGSSAVTTDKIDANAVTGSELLVKDFTNMISNPNFKDGSAVGWSGVDTNADVTVQVSTTYGFMLRFLSDTSFNITYPLGGERFSCGAGESFNVSYDAFRSAASTSADTVRVQLRGYDKDGVFIDSLTYTPTLSTGWDNYEVTLTLTDTSVVSAEYLIYSGNSGTSEFVYGTNFRIRKSANSQLIVDDAVTTSKIVADAVTTAQIAANAVTVNEIAANAVTATAIAANAVTATAIAAGTITASEIAANAITANEIAANAVTAVKILANSVTTDKINANAITSGKITANAITSGKITANAITSGKIVAGAILASHVGTNEIIANSANIKDLVVTNTKMANLAVTEAKIGNLAVTNAKLNDLVVTEAKVGTAAITNAKISNAAITTAKINDAAITNAKIADIIQADGYVAGSSGWKIDKLGDIELNNAVLRGSVLGGQTDYATGTGYFLGKSPTTYKFSMGDSVDYIRWDGTQLLIGGDIITEGNIKANSISVTDLDTTPGQLSLGAGSVWRDIATVTVTTTEASQYVELIGSWMSDRGNGNNARLSIRVTKAGSTIYGSTAIGSATLTMFGNETISNIWHNNSIAIADAPGSIGTFVYKIQLGSHAFNNFLAKNIYMKATIIKK